MKYIFFCFAIIFYCATYSESLSCKRCNPYTCKKPACRGGLVKDACNCCNVCAKVKGQICGGPWNIDGRCDKGLFCKKEIKHGLDKRNAQGRCVCRSVSHCRIFCRYGFLPNPIGCRLCKCRRVPKKVGQTCSKSRLSEKGLCNRGLECVDGRCRCRPVIAIACPFGNVIDNNGCNTGTCKKPAKLGQKCGKNIATCDRGLSCRDGKCQCGLVCAIFCPNGNIPDKNGCPTCACRPFGKVGDKCGKKHGKCSAGLQCHGGICRCGPVCEKFCPNGNVRDKNGCPICKCRPFGKVGDKCGGKHGKCNKGLHCSRGTCRCGPLCKKFCPNGNVRDKNGCPICKCRPFGKVGEKCGGKHGKCNKGLRCSKGICRCGPVCKIFCPNGNVRDKNGCPICKCRPFGKVGDKCGGKHGKCNKGLHCSRGTCRCGPVCLKFCPNGNISDRNGCPTCKCRPFGKRGDRCGGRHGKCNNGLRCSRGRCRCGPVYKIFCPNGNVLDKNNCPISKCRPWGKKGDRCGLKHGKCHPGLFCSRGRCRCKSRCGRPIHCKYGRIYVAGCPTCRCRRYHYGIYHY